MEELKESYQKDAWAQEMLATHFQGKPLPKGILVYYGIIRKQQRIYVGINNNWRERLVQSLHNSNLGGHSGIMSTYQRIKKFFY
jgi:Integrase zinc binding domain